MELDLRTKRLGLHDPEKWVVPEGFFRVVTDDDGNRPVAILRYGREPLRLTEGSDTGEADILLAPESAARVQLAGATQARGVLWGVVTLPPLSVQIVRDRFSPPWGDDGPRLIRTGAVAAYRQPIVDLRARHRTHLP